MGAEYLKQYASMCFAKQNNDLVIYHADIVAFISCLVAARCWLTLIVRVSLSHQAMSHSSG